MLNCTVPSRHFCQNCYMNIGIIGSGKMGTGLECLWAKHGHHVMFSYSRRPEKLKDLVLEIGSHARSGSPRFTETHLLRISGDRIAEDHVSANLVDLLNQLGTAQFAAA